MPADGYSEADIVAQYVEDENNLQFPANETIHHHYSAMKTVERKSEKDFVLVKPYAS